MSRCDAIDAVSIELYAAFVQYLFSICPAFLQHLPVRCAAETRLGVK